MVYLRRELEVPGPCRCQPWIYIWIVTRVKGLQRYAEVLVVVSTWQWSPWGLIARFSAGFSLQYVSPLLDASSGDITARKSRACEWHAPLIGLYLYSPPAIVFFVASMIPVCTNTVENYFTFQAVALHETTLNRQRRRCFTCDSGSSVCTLGFGNGCSAP